jgi:hypothetical protein
MRKKIGKMFCGKYFIEIRDFKEIAGHDDSLPFMGKLFINNIHVANCHNDGWGGEAVVAPMSNNISLFTEANEAIKKETWTYSNMTFNYTMSFIADILACEWQTYLQVREMQKEHLVFENTNNQTLKFIPFNHKDNKGNLSPITIGELCKTTFGVQLIKDTIEKYKKLGYKCLNTNLRFPKMM